ncbi:conserved hypothetical protein [Altererythrobacter sp. B11]|uniref:hypothetical protein n=1 Tax=Altererythrobacter sp. B11 TaxID=2060312 RepID=UPI000DC73A67|nr:hypothetical protein [Altererythrobacter sp. B11]BBC74302.1 conserved hypothetical protein [Altererythrobacter sp. B11]
MSHRRFASRLVLGACAAASLAVLASPATLWGQERPADLTVLPPVPTDYTPKKTEWGDWDFRGIWPIERINEGHILFQRPKAYGNRFWVTDEEFNRRVEAAKGNDGSFAAASDSGIGAPGTEGLAEWFQTSNFGKRTSMLVSPADGQLPPLTPEGEALYKAGRSGWVPGQDYDWLSDFDSWDRCVSRGFPASMYPFRYNNGIRVFQSPGYVVIALEMLGTRVIPLGDQPAWPGPVEAWMGDSRGHWEGKTLVIETTNIKSGDSATHDTQKRSASPLNMATQLVPPFNTIPMSTEAKTVERLTMTGPNTIVHELTYSDPKVYTKPWTTRIEWTRDDDYQFFEYACHEGNHMPRDYISASRAHRAALAKGEADPNAPDDRDRFAQPFDHDPGTGPRPPRPGS